LHFLFHVCYHDGVCLNTIFMVKLLVMSFDWSCDSSLLWWLVVVSVLQWYKTDIKFSKGWYL